MTKKKDVIEKVPVTTSDTQIPPGPKPTPTPTPTPPPPNEVDG